MNVGVVTFDPGGRLLITILPPTDFNGGTPIRDGRLCVLIEPAPIVAYVSGLPYCANGQLAVTRQAFDFFGPRGIPFGVNGRVKIATMGAIADFFVGFPYAINLGLAVSAA